MLLPSLDVEVLADVPMHYSRDFVVASEVLSACQLLARGEEMGDGLILHIAEAAGRIVAHF